MDGDLVIRHWEDQRHAPYNEFGWVSITACGTKIQYTSLSEALKWSLYIKSHMRTKSRLMTPYLCPVCFYYHLGRVYISQAYTDFIVFGRGDLPKPTLDFDDSPLLATAKRVWGGLEEVYNPSILSALNTAFEQELLDDPDIWMYKLGPVVFPAEELVFFCLKQNIQGTIGFMKIEPGVLVDILTLQKTTI